MDRSRPFVMSQNNPNPAVFARQSSTRGNMEQLPPIRPLWHEITATVCIVIILALCAWAH